jgi:hypothetical protein
MAAALPPAAERIMTFKRTDRIELEKSGKYKIIKTE